MPKANKQHFHYQYSSEFNTSRPRFGATRRVGAGANTAGAIMTSLEIAAITGKRHANVMRDIKKMLQQLGKDELSFERIFFDSMNRKQTEYCLDRLHVECLLTGYSAPLRMCVLERLSELESAEHSQVPVPTTFAEALRLAADQSEQIQSLQLTHQNDTMKIDVLEQLLAAGVTATDFCRRLNGVNTMMVNGYLRDAGWLFEPVGTKSRWRVASYARDKYMAEKAFEVMPEGTDRFTVFNIVLLKAGAKRLVALYMAGKLPMKKTWDREYSHDLAGAL